MLKRPSTRHVPRSIKAKLLKSASQSEDAKTMNYGHQPVDYALRSSVMDSVEHYDEYAETTPPQYTRKRSAKAFRQRGKNRSGAAHPGCGFGGRRNRHYSW